MPADGRTKVHIFGQSYHLKSGEGPERTREVARLVDEKMNLVATQAGAADHFRIAVLTALHLADEYLSLEKEHQHLQSEVSSKADRIAALLEGLDPEPTADSEPILPAAD